MTIFFNRESADATDEMFMRVGFGTRTLHVPEYAQGGSLIRRYSAYDFAKYIRMSRRDWNERSRGFH